MDAGYPISEWVEVSPRALSKRAGVDRAVLAFGSASRHIARRVLGRLAGDAEDLLPPRRSRQANRKQRLERQHRKAGRHAEPPTAREDIIDDLLPSPDHKPSIKVKKGNPALPTMEQARPAAATSARAALACNDVDDRCDDRRPRSTRPAQ